MMNQDINNQNTLFRFVILRSAELSQKENQNKRFVFHPDNKSGFFFDAVNNKPSDETKWSAMERAAVNFTAFANVKQLEEAFPEYYSLSEWLTKNKSTLTAEEIQSKTDAIHPLDEKKETNLWDNLFYQVVTQKEFYVKEGIIQLLVLQHILKNKQDTFNKEKTELITILTQAKVVLPVDLFGVQEQETTQYANKKEEFQIKKYDFVSQDIIEAKEIHDTKILSNNIEYILSELNKIEKKYTEDFQKEYFEQLKNHQKEINPTLTEYHKNYRAEQKRLCEKPKEENYDPDDICNQPDLDYPDLPEFVFDREQEPDLKSLPELLPHYSYQQIEEIINIRDIHSFSDLKFALENKLSEAENKVASQLQTNNNLLQIGGVIIPVASRTPNKDKDFTFQICTMRLSSGNYSPYMIIQLPDSGYSVQQFIYHLHYNNGVNNTNGSFTPSYSGNTLTLGNMFGASGLPSSVFSLVQGISGFIVFSNGTTYTFELNPFSLTGCYGGTLLFDGQEPGNGNNDPNNSFTPNTFGYRQLGIADYKKVVSKICKYEVGEVAHIENVMARELREKSTKSFHQTQVVETESTEIETEKITDTSTTERFEMQTEIAKLLQEQKQNNSYVNVSASYYGVTLDAGASWASNVSKEESNRQAVIQSKEITQRATERITARVKNEKTVTTTDEFTEENTHVFDNTESGEHVSGVFRFINAIYKNQIYNYGKRLMYEFMVPQPSKLHELGMQVSSNSANTSSITKPTDPRSIGIDSFTKINSGNYQALVSKYNADTEVYPDTYVFANKAFSGAKAHENELYDGVSEVEIPQGYYAKSARLKFFSKYDNDSSQRHAVGISFGNYNLFADEIRYSLRETNLTGYLSNFPLDQFVDKLSVSYSIINYLTFNFSLSIQCEIKPESIVEWQKKTFDAIIAGYESQLQAYNQSVSEAQASGIQILDSNPLFYRQIEQNVLRMNCISYLLDHNNPNSYKKFGLPMYNSGASFTNFQVNLDQNMDNYGSFAKFMEQAFEWDMMSYNFYPFYWGNKAEWKDLYQFDSNDAIFRSFMQAGMARVVVTVRPGFEDAVMHYLATGQIWLGGQVPVIGDPLYLSIVDELKEQEYVVEETWTTTLPTQLIALQKSGVAVDAEGLPTLDACEAQENKKLIANDSTLGAGEKLTERIAKIENRMIENIDINDGKIKLTTKGKNRQVVAQISVEDLKREME